MSGFSSWQVYEIPAPSDARGHGSFKMAPCAMGPFHHAASLKRCLFEHSLVKGETDPGGDILKTAEWCFQERAGSTACNLPLQGSGRGHSSCVLNCVKSLISWLNSIFKHFYNPFLGGKVKTSLPGFDLRSWRCISGALAGKQAKVQRDADPAAGSWGNPGFQPGLCPAALHCFPAYVPVCIYKIVLLLQEL